MNFNAQNVFFFFLFHIKKGVECHLKNEKTEKGKWTTQCNYRKIIERKKKSWNNNNKVNIHDGYSNRQRNLPFFIHIISKKINAPFLRKILIKKCLLK